MPGAFFAGAFFPFAAAFFTVLFATFFVALFADVAARAVAFFPRLAACFRRASAVPAFAVRRAAGLVRV